MNAPRLAPVRVGLLGIGTVGAGTFTVLARNQQEITRRAGRGIEIVVVADLDVARAREIVGDRARVTGDAFSVVRDPSVEVVIELIGGYGIARQLVLEAIAHGKHVVTANKALLARHGEELHALAARHGGTLRGSAAVGGAAPVLATVARACRRGPIHRFVGVLNATSGFVLDRLAAGASLADAVHAAAAAGLAERAVALDLDGVDAAQKLVLCARAAGVAAAEADVATQSATAAAPADLATARAGGGRVRLVAAWTQGGGVGGRPTLRVAPELLHPDHELAFLAADECGAAIRCADGATLRCRGRGAGRWPTAEAVVADLLELVRARADAAAEAAS
jgi:homoserine dehydrogenase